MAQVLQDVAEMAISFERSRGYSLPSFKINQTTAYSNQHPSDSQHYKTNKCTQQTHSTPMLKQRSLNAGNAKVTILRKIAPWYKQAKVSPNTLGFRTTRKGSVKY